MPDAHKNFAVSAVATAPSPAASGTTLVVTAGHGTRFPAVPFNATVWPTGFQPDPTNAEIVRVTNIAGDTLTITRAQEGSTVRAIVVTDQIAATITAKTLTDAEAPDGVAAVAASNTTYSSGTISLTGVGGGVTVSSNTGQRIDISVAAQSLQPETQTFIGGISASDTLYTSGSVRLTGVGGGITVSSNTGQRVDLSVAAPVAQTVQTQNVVDLTLAGNTAGALALVSSGTLTLAGGQNITLSQAGNAVTISGATAAAGAATAISGLANSQTTYTSGTVSFSVVAGNLTIRSTTGQAFQFSASQSVQPETQTFLAGAAASNTTYSSGTFSLTGVGGGITVGSNTGQRIDLSVAAPVAQTNQSGNLYASSNTFGTSSGTYDARSISLAGRGAVSVAASNSGWIISAPTQTTQVETQTFVGGVANSQTTYTSGTVSLSELGAITVRSTTGNQFQLSVNSQTVQTQNLHNVTVSGNTSGALAAISSGTLTLAGGNNITISQAGNALTISGANVGGAQTGISGIAASNTTYTSGTVSFTGVGGGITVSSNTGQRVDLSVAAQTVQTQNLIAATLSGNTSGAQALISSGTLTLAGGNNITVSQAGNAVTISGANVGGAQTGISGLANSQTTYTSGTVSLSELGAITIRSTTGNQFQLSVNSQTNQAGSVYAASNTSGTSSGTYDARTLSIAGAGIVTVAASNSGWRIDATTAAQTNQTGNVYASSNTFGTSSGTYDARSISIAGRGAVSVAASNSGWIISAPAQSVQAETQTFVGGIANSQTTYTSGTVSLSELGAITIRSTTGNQYQLSVNSQTVQTQNLHNVTISGNTSGALAAISSGTLTLAGGNNITLSQAGNAVTISAGAGGAFSAGMSTEGNTAGNTGVTGSRLVLVGSNNISLSQTTGAAGATLTFNGPASSSLSATGAVSISVNGSTISIGAPAQTAQTQSLIQALYDGANSITTGTIRVTNANGVSFSVNAQTLSASVNESISMFAVSNTTQSTSGTAHKSAMSFGGAGIASVGVTGGSVVVSVPAGAGQTAISGLANSQTTYTSGTVSLSELGAITIRSTTGNQFQLSVNAQTTQTQGILSAGVSTGGNTAGNTTVNTGSRMVLVGTNMISLSQGTGAAASTITFDATNQNLSIGVSTGGNTAGNTTVNSGSRFVIVGSNGITASAGTAAGATTVTLSGVTIPPAQTGISGIANSQTTYTSGTVSLSELGAITIRSTTGNQYQFSVNSQTVQTQGILNVALSNIGNTLGDTGVNSGTRLVLAGGNNITLSGSSAAGASTITIVGPSPGAAQYSVGVSTGGNTSGNTGVTGTRIVFAATNNITLSQATDATGATITISGPTAGAFSAGVSTGGNTAGDTGVTGTRLVFVGNSPMSLSQATATAGGTISINAPATSSLSGTGGIEISTTGSTISIGYGNNLADWQNMPNLQASLLTHVSAISKTPFYWNDHLDGDLTAKSLALKISMVTASQPLSVSVHLGVFTFVNSTSANRLASHSEAFVVSSASSVSLSGVRNLILTGIGTHATLSTISGGEYMLGLMFSATATNAMNFSLYGAGVGGSGAGALGGLYPGTNNLTTGTSQGIQAMYGRGSTTINAMPSAVSAADLVNQGSGASAPLHPWIYIRS